MKKIVKIILPIYWSVLYDRSKWFIVQSKSKINHMEYKIIWYIISGISSDKEKIKNIIKFNDYSPMRKLQMSMNCENS